MGLEALKQHIGWDLKENVGDEENDKRIVVLCSIEAEFFREAENIGICDVDAIWAHCVSW